MIGRVVLCLAAAAAPAAAQDPAGSLALGVRGGIEIHRGEAGEKHVGVQAWIPLRDRLDVVPALDLLYQFPGDPLGAWSGRAWQTYVTLRVRPFNQGWLPTVGYGLNARYAQANNAGRSLSVSSLDVTDTVVFAFAGPRWRIRPFAEVYVLNVLRRADHAGVHVFLGLSAVVR